MPSGKGPLWHHIGIYAYRREGLGRFVSLPPSPLERREKLEQLRDLEPACVSAPSRTPPSGSTSRPTSNTPANCWEPRHDPHRLPGPGRTSPATWPIPACKLPYESFAATIAAVRDGAADLAMLPPENSIAGRTDMHALLPKSGLFIIGERFLRIEHCLVGLQRAAQPTAVLVIKR